MWLIPWLSLLYLLSFLDRTNIGNARVAKMEPDLKMGGRDYNNALTIFFISYAGFEPLTNIAIKKWSPRVFFTAIILAWGIIMTLMGVVHNKAGLLACRWFLGIAEAGLFPGVNYYLSYDFPRRLKESAMLTITQLLVQASRTRIPCCSLLLRCRTCRLVWWSLGGGHHPDAWHCWLRGMAMDL